MSDPSADLQRAVFEALAADAGIRALLGDPARLYDRVPGPSPVFPYATLFEVQTVEDGTDCRGGSEAFIDIHIWSQMPGAIEAKRIVSAVRSALHGAALDLGEDHALIDLVFQDHRTFRDPDGLTTHSVITFRALTEDH